MFSATANREIEVRSETKEVHNKRRPGSEIQKISTEDGASVDLRYQRYFRLSTKIPSINTEVSRSRRLSEFPVEKLFSPYCDAGQLKARLNHALDSKVAQSHTRARTG